MIIQSLHKHFTSKRHCTSLILVANKSFKSIITNKILGEYYEAFNICRIINNPADFSL